MEWHLPSDKPLDFQTGGLTGIIFCDSQNYYVGSTGADRKWYARNSDKVLDEIDAWAFLPDEPIVLQKDVVEQDWIAGNGPVGGTHPNFLLYDHGEIIYANLDSPHFDTQLRTFPEVSYHVILPGLPVRLAGKVLVSKQKALFMEYLRQNASLNGLVLDTFNNACLERSVKELLNTTTNGVRRGYLLQGKELASETISRWAFQANNGLNKAEGRPFLDDPLGILPPPADSKAREESKALLERIVAALKF
jgi:hypothetical protein